MLVTVEGIDGSGKSTICEALAERFPEAVLTREPTESWYGEAVRRSVASPEADPLAELFLYTADHADHLSRLVAPALEENRLVISDRYSDSRYAYQGVSLADRFDDPVEFVRAVHQPWTIPPDLTLYLDVSPETGATRSDGGDKFETAPWLAAVADRYEAIIDAEPDRFYRIDAEATPSAVLEEAVEVLDRAIES